MEFALTLSRNGRGKLMMCGRKLFRIGVKNSVKFQADNFRLISRRRVLRPSYVIALCRGGTLFQPRPLCQRLVPDEIRWLLKFRLDHLDFCTIFPWHEF